MKKLGLLALISALFWFAWQLGFQQAEHPELGFVASQKRVISATLAHPIFHQTSVKSERFLQPLVGASVYESEREWGHREPKTSPHPWQVHYHETNASLLDNIGAVWQQAGFVLVSLEPLAKTTWGLVQSSWQQLTADKTQSKPWHESAHSVASEPHENTQHP